MSESHEPIAVEELLAQSGWLSALARRLVADEHRADDLVQQVWLQAIARPPRREGSVRGWLRAALTSRWRDEHRADAARRSRERAGFQERTVPATAEIAARVEAQQAVARAVLDLPEPLRGVVLLHFFEELPLREAARRLDVPYETARDRLARALDVLRRRLREEHRDDEVRGLALLACAGGREGPAAPGAAGRGASRWTAPRIGFGVAVGIAVVAVGVAASVTSWPWDAGSGAVSPVGAGTAGETRTLRDGTGDSARADDVAATIETPDVAGAGPTRRARAGVRLLTVRGDAVAGASVEAWALPSDDAGAPTRVRVATTDAAGRASFEGLAPGRWTFVARTAGRATASATRELAAGGRNDVALFVGMAHRLAGRVVDHDARPIAGATVMGATPRPAWDGIVPAVHVTATTDADGRYALADLPFGETTLWAALPGGEPSPLANVLVPAVERVDLVLRRGGTVRGRITEEETGAPVAGAEVRVKGSGATGPVFGRTTSGADGRFVLAALLECDLHRIGAAKDGYGGDALSARQSSSDAVALHRGTVVTRDLVLRRGGRVTGRVTCAGAPVEGAAVIVRFANALGEWAARRTTTDAGGRYVAAHAGPGQAVVRVEAPGLREAALSDPKVADSISLAPFAVDVPERGVAVFDVALDADPAPLPVTARLRGTVVAAGDAVRAGTSREVWVDVPGGGGADRVLAGPDGAFEFDLPPHRGARSVRVRATSIDWSEGWWDCAEAWSDEIQLGAAGEPTPIRLTVGRGITLSGVVRSRAGGSAVDGALVRIGSRANAGPSAQRGANLRAAPVAATTDTDGRFDARGLAPGSYEVLVAAEGFVSSTATVDVPAKEAAVVDLSPAFDMSGRVEFGDGAPLAGVRVTAVPASPSGAAASARASVAEDGSFTLRGLAAGLYAIHVNSPGQPGTSFAQPAPPTAEAGARDVRVVVLHALDISGRVLDAAGRPARGVFVLLETEGPKPQPAVTGDDGAFAFPNLAEGVYGVVARTTRPDVEPSAARIEGVAAGARGIELVLAPALTIEGLLVDVEGRPVAGAAVGPRPVGRPSSDQHEGYLPAGADGRFVVRGLPPGAYEIAVANLRARLAPFVVRGQREFTAGATGLRLEIRPALAVTGRLADAEGPALADRTVEFVPDDPAWPRRRARTGADGQFACAGLGPGRHRAECLEDGDASQRTPCGEFDAGAQDVELTLR